jgi:hypothetical protein
MLSEKHHKADIVKVHFGSGPTQILPWPREWDRNTHNRVPFAVDGAESNYGSAASQLVRVAQS